MITVPIHTISLLQFEGLNRYPELLHFSTTRKGGASSENYRGLNLGYNSGDDPSTVLSNRKELCAALNIDLSQLIFPKQTHTATVKLIDRPFLDADEVARKSYLQDTDAVVTAEPEVCLAVKTADCVPVLLYDPTQKVIAAIHAGWRGTVQQIVTRSIALMTRHFGTNPADLQAGIGPSISPQVYEVGDEVWSTFLDRFHAPSSNGAHKRMLDLWQANYHQLVEAGVPAEQIEVAKLCTHTHADLFFSARRDGAKTGRMASGLMLRGQ